MPGTGITAPTRVSLGENSRMLVGGVHQGIQGGIFIAFVQGTLDVTPAENDATDNTSGGFTVPSRGPRTMRMNADCLFRISDNPIGNLPKFSEGDLTSRIIVWPDFNNSQNTYFKMPSAFCGGFTITMVSTADVRFTLTLRNDGVYYTPSRPDPAGVFA